MNTQKYVITHPKDETGTEIKFVFMISLSKPVKAIGEAKINALMGVDGIDTLAQRGRYTLEITISRAFNADEVISVLKTKLDDAMSDIIVPKLVI